jgi:hypothetical protein
MAAVSEDIQEHVRTDLKASVAQAKEAAQEVAEEVKEVIMAAKNTAVQGLEALLGESHRWLWLVIAIISLVGLLLLIMAIALFFTHNASGGMASASGGVGGIVSALLGYFGLGKLQEVKEKKTEKIEEDHNAAAEAAKTKVNSQAAPAPAEATPAGSGMISRLESGAQQAGKTLLEALERGYEQARIELDGLNRSVAVAYPLVEFFVLTFVLKSEAAFLTQIIWSGTEREEELKRVVRAAFGPLAVFITPTSKEKPEDT